MPMDWDCGLAPPLLDLPDREGGGEPRSPERDLRRRDDLSRERLRSRRPRPRPPPPPPPRPGRRGDLERERDMCDC